MYLAYFLKRVIAPILNVLGLYFFKLTLAHGNLPAQWKAAFVFLSIRK